MTDSEFEKIIIQQKEKLYRFAFSILKQKEDAQDAVQEVVLKLWNKKKLLNSSGNLESYCMSSVKNYALDLLRKNKQHLNYKSSGLIEETENSNIENRDLIEKMRTELKHLPVQQRMAIELKDFQGYEYEEISEILEMNINAIRVNVSRGRKRLYEIFKDELKNV